MKNSSICFVVLIFLAVNSMAQSRRTRRGTAPSKPTVVYGSPSTGNESTQGSPKAKRITIKLALPAQSPAFSPDGTKIAFIGKRGTIWIKDIGSNILREVNSQYSAVQPSWSPDGKMIAFAHYGTLNGQTRVRNLNGDLVADAQSSRLSIWLIDIDGKNARQLIKPMPEQDQWPCWSPDGKEIVLSHGDHLWIVDSNGAKARPLTLRPAKAYEYCGQWFPRGDLLAYLARDDHAQEEYRIWTIDPTGQGQVMVLHGISASRVRWARDGKSLYYMSREGVSDTGPVPNHIMKVDLSGSTPAKNLAELPYTTQDFDISPDERWIAYDDLPDESPTKSPTIYLQRLP